MNRLIAPTLSVTAAIAVSLGCYLVSAQVGAERARVAQLRAEIARDEADERTLEAELMRRGAFVRLEEWNASALRMEAPLPAQMLARTAELVALAPAAPRLTEAKAEAAPIEARVILVAARQPSIAQPTPPGPAEREETPAAPRLVAAELRAASPPDTDARIAARAPKPDESNLADLTRAVERDLKAADPSPLKRVSLR